MNTVNLIGNLTKDIEIKNSQNDKPYVLFTLAVRRDKETTDFIDCSAWNKTAEMMKEYCKKGEKIGVTGQLRVNVKKTEDSFKKFVDVVVSSITFLGQKEKTQKVSDLGPDEFPF